MWTDHTPPCIVSPFVTVTICISNAAYSPLPHLSTPSPLPHLSLPHLSTPSPFLPRCTQIGGTVLGGASVCLAELNVTKECEGGLTLHPCCVGLLGECVVTTEENCTFQDGYWHPDKVCVCVCVCVCRGERVNVILSSSYKRDVPMSCRSCAVRWARTVSMTSVSSLGSIAPLASCPARVYGFSPPSSSMRGLSTSLSLD